MIFVDAWAWVALALRRDQHHQSVKTAHAQMQREGRRYVTTNFILSELIAHLYTTLSANEAQRFVNALLSGVKAQKYELVHVSSDQFNRAWDMRQKFHDKPDISFVDFTSKIVMEDLGIYDVFAGDSHFHHVGLGFRLFP